MALVLIGLGSNVGDRRQFLESAVARLRALRQCEVLAVSAWQETVPAGGPAGQPAYLNGCVLLQTALQPELLLAELQSIENQLGRTREQTWCPRTIDLDLLLYDELQWASPTLTIPHPRMAWRRFVIDSAAEIAPSMRHPASGWTMEQLRKHLAQTPFYIAITGVIAAGKLALANAVVDRHRGLLHEARVTADWSRGVPANSAFQKELMIATRRSVGLARGEAKWSDVTRPIVSNFWFDQSLAFARVWLPQEELATFVERWRKFQEHIVRPRLTVFIDPPTDILLERIRTRARGGEEVFDAVRIDALRSSLRQQIDEPENGPVMRLTGNEQGVWVNELSAAITAMR